MTHEPFGDFATGFSCRVTSEVDEDGLPARPRPTSASIPWTSTALVMTAALSGRGMPAGIKQH